MQVVSVFRGRVLIGAVDDGKVVGFYWREIGVGGVFFAWSAVFWAMFFGVLAFP